MSRVMRKLDFCLCENKGADQLCSNCEAEQGLCFLYSDSIIPLLLIAKISSLWPASVIVQAGLYCTWSKKNKDQFSHYGAQLLPKLLTETKRHEKRFNNFKMT